MPLTLDTQQQMAVEHAGGPLLIVAGAGTGKTTVITERVKHLIGKKKASPNEILALTFTEKAATEMLDRLDEVMPLGYEEPWLSTFHAFCDRVLRLEGLEVGLSPDYTILGQPQQWMLIKQNLFDLKLDYYRPLGNPTKFIGALLNFFSRLQDEDLSEAKLRKLQSSHSKFRKKVGKEEFKKYQELFQAFGRYQELKLAENVLDFGDLVTWTLELFRKRQNVLGKYQQQFRQILVDEFQDTNLAQLQLIKLLAPAKKNPNLVVVGDDDQCLPGDSKISLADKTQKEIRKLKAGDKVLTAVGKGHYSIAKVSKVMRSMKRTRFISFKTESGKQITTTDNHKMFCFIPTRETEKKWHYVYLMHQLNRGWRIGTTNDLAQRLRLERQVDRIIAIGSYQSLEEALYFETLYSLKYQLPKVCFTERPGIAIRGEWLNRLLKEIDTEEKVKKLANGLGIDLNSHHVSQGGVVRGKTRRVKINLIMCYRRYRSKVSKNGFLADPKVIHLLSVETSDRETIEKLRHASFYLTKAKGGSRLRLESADLIHLGKEVKKLQEITGGIIDVKFVVGRKNITNKPSLIMPAGNVFPGNFLPVLTNKGIEYDRVIERKEEIKEETVYDLEIERTHNFIADGVVVHNSIYKWRGAAISNILDFKKHYPKAKEIVLTQNYRSGQKLLDRAYKLIQNNNPDRLETKLKVDKHLVSRRSDKLPDPQAVLLPGLESEADFVVEKILELVAKKPYTYKDFAILARANNHLEPFVAALKRSGIPYQLLGNRGLFDQDEVRSLFFFLKVVVDPTDTLSLFQLLHVSVFGVKADLLLEMLQVSRQAGKTLWQVMQESSPDHSGLQFLVDQVGQARQRAVKEPASPILYDFIQATDYLREFLERESIENQLKINNVNLFFEQVKRFEGDHKNSTLVDCVEFLELLMEAGENPAQAEIEDIDTVNLLTVHSAKGLEFPVVFVVNLVSDRFPTRHRRDPIEIPKELVEETLPEGNYHLQEERRLFYVALTRAKDFAFVTAGRDYGGVRKKHLSGFVTELGVKVLEPTVSSGTQLSLLKSRAEPKPKKVIDGRTQLNFVSYSQIDVFKTCPLKYKYRYILRVPVKPHHALTFGQSIHNTLRDFHRFEQQGQKPSRDTLLYLYEKHFIPFGYEGEKHKQARFKKGEEALLRYFRTYKSYFSGTPFRLEQPFRLNLGETWLMGKIDRIDRLSDTKYELIDYKTGSVKEQSDVDKDAQLTIYKLAAQSVLGIAAETLSLFFIEGKEDPKKTTTRNLEQLEKKKQEIVDTVVEMKSSKFGAKPGDWCKYCEYNRICPFAKNN